MWEASARRGAGKGSGATGHAATHTAGVSEGGDRGETREVGEVVWEGTGGNRGEAGSASCTGGEVEEVVVVVGGGSHA